jgi:SpoVK/Ycf46/Vps4 family AAA+-type ATPase
MLTSRSEHENDASRRLKTEFLVLMDGINSPKSGDVLVIGATNLPKELDNAAKRRFSKLIYIGNPDSEARREMVVRNMKDIEYDLSNSDLNKIVDKL